MIYKLALSAVAPALLFGSGASAQVRTDDTSSRALGADITYSSDADQTEVVAAGINLDWSHKGPDDYKGVRLERAWFSPMGQERTSDERIYLRLANSAGRWKWNARIGTDGDTVLGTASIYSEGGFRKEFFVERDKIETSQGVALDLYSTYAGAAIDLPIDDRNVVTLLAGVQDFTGSNLRKHLRANYIHVIKPEWGLSAQLRTRYFHNSDPREFDYFSPRWYVEALPIVQLRRFSAGWRYLAAAGWGAQRDSESDWRESRYLNLRAMSPASGKGWSLNGDFTYSSTPITDNATYDYVRVTFGVTRAF